MILKKVTQSAVVISSGVALALIAGAFPGMALAVGNAYFPQATTLQMTISSVVKDFTISAGSDADSVVGNASSVTITMSPGQQLIITSADRYMFRNNDNFETVCTTSLSTITLTVGSARSFTITPDGSTCSNNSTNTGGTIASSGGSGGAAAVAIQQSTTPTPSVTPVPVGVGVGAIGNPVNLTTYGLKEGQVMGSADAGDPDVFIVNTWGYKRLFLNPAIFNFYGHLGGFTKVKSIVPVGRDAFVTSGLFRNCETEDQKVYAVEVTGEDAGILHWVNMTGNQAAAQDPEFFHRVFCINSREFGWYQQSSTAYTSLTQVPVYQRQHISVPVISIKNLTVVSSVPYLNVRSTPAVTGTLIAQLQPGEVVSYSEVSNGWYKIQKNGADVGWVSGLYIVIQ